MFGNYIHVPSVITMQETSNVPVKSKRHLHPTPGCTPGVWHLFLHGREGIWSPLIGGGEFDR